MLKTRLTTDYRIQWPFVSAGMGFVALPELVRNRVVGEWEGSETGTPPPPEGPRSIGTTLIGGQPYPMPKYSAALPTRDTDGDFEEMCLAAGDSAASVTRLQPAGEVVQEMMEEAEATIRGLRIGVGPR